MVGQIIKQMEGVERLYVHTPVQQYKYDIAYKALLELEKVLKND